MIGLEHSTGAGLETRFDHPWPLGSLSLKEHPIARLGGALLNRHGARVLDRVLEAYDTGRLSRAESRGRARLLSICIACRHAMRSERLKKPHRMKAARSHLERVLGNAG